MSFPSLNGQPLAKHRWKDRLILLFEDQEISGLARWQMERFEREMAAMKDRDLLIYRIRPGRVRGPEGERLSADAGWWYDRYGVEEWGFAVILIGKDGGEKLRADERIEPQRIFDLIDTMPMRRSEMRRRKDDGR